MHSGLCLADHSPGHPIKVLDGLDSGKYARLCGRKECSKEECSRLHFFGSIVICQGCDQTVCSLHKKMFPERSTPTTCMTKCFPETSTLPSLSCVECVVTEKQWISWSNPKK